MSVGLAIRRCATALALAAVAFLCAASGSALAQGPLDPPTFQTTYSDEVVADSPTSYWRLGESSGSTMVDARGVNAGTYFSAALGQPGAFPFDSNTAVSFNGTTSRALVPDSSSLDRTGAVTVEMWVKRTKNAAYQVLLGKAGNGQSRFENYAIWLNTTNRAQAYFGNGTSFVSTVSGALDTNWHHVVATYDNAVARIYVDGIQAHSATSTVALTPNAQPLNIGRPDSNQYYYGGLLDEVAIYPTALSAARIQAHFAKASADTTPPAVTLTQPANGSSTNDTTPSFVGVAGTASGDSATVTTRVYLGAGTSGTLLQSLTSTAGGGGSYTTTATALPEGTYTARSEQADNGGNTGLSALTTFTIDTSGPSVSITGGPADPTSSTDASLSFTTEAGAGLECKLDAGAYAACTSPKDYTGLGEGSHVFSVRATDIAGNTGPAATRDWTVDTTGPSASISGGPGDPTNSTDASLTFGSEAGASFECKLDAGAYAACTSPKDYTGLSEGNHVFSVRATDSAGNTGSGTTRSWTVDTSGPSVSITGGPADPTSSTDAALTFSSEEEATFQCKLDNGGYAACASPKGYTGLGEGAHTFSVRATDSAGNTGSGTTRSWTVDTSGPSVSITGGPADPTSSTDASLSFTTEAGAGLECKLDAGSYAACTSPKDYTGLSEGNHVFSVRATDSAGNTGSGTTRSWTVDTSGPSVSITGGPADPTSSTDASLSFTTEAGAGLECKLDAGSYAACTSPKDYTGLSEGNHVFSVRATDGAGNSGPAATRSWTVDTSGPAITLTSPADGSETNDPSPSVSGVAGTAAGDSATITVRVYTGSTASGSPVQTLSAARGAGGAYAIAPAALADGTYTAQAEQDDSAGNSSLTPTTTFTVDPGAGDTTAPVISLLAPADGSATNDSTPAFSGVAGLALGDSATVTVRVYAGPTVLDPLVATITTTRGGDGSYAAAATSELADGLYTARAEQPDGSSNTGFSGAATFTVDTSGPGVSITGGPSDPTSSTNASLSFTTEAGASLECKLDVGAYAACASPKDYTGLSEGAHVLSVRATDTAGNTGPAATREWDVDTSAPPATIDSAPADPSTSTDAMLTFSSEAGASFECKLDDGAYAGCTSPKSYAGLSESAHVFSVRATDAAGNTGTAATRTWTIDASGPAVQITGGPSDPTNSSSASISFTSEPGATFQCKIDNASFDPCTSPRVYGGLGQGNRVVSVRATDSAGNTGDPATHSWTIDPTAPLLTITSPPNGSSTTDTTPNLAGVAGQAIGDSATITVDVYAGTSATGSPVQTLSTTRGAGGAYNIDAAALADGTYTARSTQSDNAGNTGQSGTTTFTIDTVAPVLTLTSPANGSSPSTATPAFSGVAGSAGGDSATITVRIYPGSTPTGTPTQTLTATRGGGSYSVNSATLAQGTYTARAEQSDAAGNTTLSSANTFSLSDPVMIGAGDIAGCGESDGRQATAALLAQNPNATVFTLGDNVYPSGQPADYTNCYDPTWGAAKARTRPITGGHDTETVSGGALPNSGFSNYFASQLAPYGETATNRLKAYYSYDIGAWHVVALNSACYFDLPGCNVAQMEQWFRDDLASHNNVCTAVMWHDSRWGSGEIHGNEDFVQPLWEIAYDGGADIVLGGNEHVYERFAPQDANGALDNAFGMRAFVVGTGGYYHYGLGTLKPNSQVFNGDTYGVLKLTLHPTSYDWQFVPEAGATFTDSGTGDCHGAPSAPSGTPTVRAKSSASAPYPSTSLTIAKPAGTTAGDVLLATVSHQGGSGRSISPPAGWTNIPGANAADGSNARIHAFYKVATGAEPATYAFALTGGGGMSIAGGVAALQGASTTSPINAAGAANTGGANVLQLTAPSITTTKPNTALVYSGAVNKTATFTPPQLMPEQWDLVGGGSYQVANSTAIGGVAAAGPTGSRAATLSTSARGVASAIAIAGP